MGGEEQKDALSGGEGNKGGGVQGLTSKNLYGGIKRKKIAESYEKELVSRGKNGGRDTQKVQDRVDLLGRIGKRLGRTKGANLKEHHRKWEEARGRALDGGEGRERKENLPFQQENTSQQKRENYRADHPKKTGGGFLLGRGKRTCRLDQNSKSKRIWGGETLEYPQRTAKKEAAAQNECLERHKI